MAFDIITKYHKISYTMYVTGQVFNIVSQVFNVAGQVYFWLAKCYIVHDVVYEIICNIVHDIVCDFVYNIDIICDVIFDVDGCSDMSPRRQTCPPAGMMLCCILCRMYTTSYTLTISYTMSCVWCCIRHRVRHRTRLRIRCHTRYRIRYSTFYWHNSRSVKWWGRASVDRVCLPHLSQVLDLSRSLFSCLYTILYRHKPLSKHE